MSECLATKNGGRTNIVATISAVVAVVAAIMQFMYFSVQFGEMHKQVEDSAEWIKGRQGAQIDSRLAVLENRMTSHENSVLSITRELSLHIQNDTDRWKDGSR